MENQSNKEAVLNTHERSTRSSNRSGNVPNAMLNFFEANKKAVIYVGGGLLALIVILIGYRMYQRSQDGDAQRAMFMPEIMWDKDSFKMAQKGLQDVADEYPGTNTANRSHYLLGMGYLHQGKYQDAIDELEKFSSKSAIMMPLAYGGIGDAYCQLKDYTKAASYYKKAANFSDNEFTTPYFYKKAALVTDVELKDYKEALSMYKILKEKYKSTTFAQDADKYINRAQAHIDSGE